MQLDTSEARDLVYESFDVSSNFADQPSEWGVIREKLRMIEARESEREWDLETKQIGASFTYGMESGDYRIEGKVDGLVQDYF